MRTALLVFCALCGVGILCSAGRLNLCATGEKSIYPQDIKTPRKTDDYD
jgi:hypothetical protein